MKRLGIWLVLIGLLAFGCTPASKPPKWDAISYNLTGGIAGFDQQLILKKSGSYDILNRGKNVASGEASAKELAAVNEAMAKVEWETIAAKYVDPRVADAMFDGVTVTLGNKQFSTVAGTGGNPPPALSQLIDALRQVLVSHRNG